MVISFRDCSVADLKVLNLRCKTAEALEDPRFFLRGSDVRTMPKSSHCASLFGIGTYLFSHRNYIYIYSATKKKFSVN